LFVSPFTSVQPWPHVGLIGIHVQEHEDTVATPRESVELSSTPVSSASVDEVRATTYDPFAARRQGSYKLIQAVYLIFGVIEALLLIRFVLRALGANPQAGFAQFIYGITAVLVAPFVGLFGTPQSGGSALELSTLVALVVYPLLGWLIAKLLWLALGERRSGTTTSAESTHTRVP